MKAILVSRNDEKQQAVDVVQLSKNDLMEGDVTVAVEATTINYKDALAITGKAPVVRHWPMVPGIDFAGTVIESSSDTFKEGDKVLLNGYGVGETHWGGYAEFARVNSKWLIPLPTELTAKEAMGIGTAGYTAMLCVLALERHGLTPESGPVIVSGANGGVGTVAIAILSKLGFTVVASTGRPDESGFLKQLGASEVVERSELSKPSDRPLGREKWAGGIDVAGSHTLANMLSCTKHNGAVAACGLAQGADLPATVMPFILRGVALYGIDSAMAHMALRTEAWRRLGEDLDLHKLQSITSEISFDQIIPTASLIMEGKIRGRIIASVCD